MDSIIIDEYCTEAAGLLCRLIQTPSMSKKEGATAQIIASFFKEKNIPFTRIENNILSTQTSNVGKPLLVLNSHHDTVAPAQGWLSDPFDVIVSGDKITGLGSNDAGASLVSLLMTFVHFYEKELPYQLMIIASAEEEISGENGLRKVLTDTNIKPALAIVGEPTGTNLAIAEKGLLVIDAYAKGKSGHAAHQYDDNAITNALEDIQNIQVLNFEKVSEQLGPVKLTVTQINAGKQHNVVPDECHFVIDCRVNEHYSNQEVLDEIRAICTAKCDPRSLHLNASGVSISHPIVQKGIAIGKQTYGSPTLSDQVFFDCPSVKVGPGESNRSHQANEYVLKSEIREGIRTYINLISAF